MTLKSYDVSHPEYMQILQDGQTLFGCNQDWYRIEWRRRAGCGPVAATNILFYLRKKYDESSIPYSNISVEDALDAMNDVFQFVRPKRRGLHTVRKLVKGMSAFGRRYGLSFRYRYLLVPPQAEKRPGLGEVVRFIMEGLGNDVPVAFLNLHAGAVEEQLSSWHWVTVVGITADTALGEEAGNTVCSNTADTALGEEAGNTVCSNTADTAILRFYDQSKCLEVELDKWLSTTEKGGGFAYFYKPSQSNTIRYSARSRI